MDNRERLIEELTKKHIYYKETFDSINGLKVLEDLEEKYYINRSTTGKSENIDMFLRGVREGQRIVVLYLKNMISDKQLKQLGINDEKQTAN